MKNIKHLLFGAVALLLAACSTTPETFTNEYGTRWHWEGGTIVTETPERPAGQQSALGLTAPRLEVVRVGFVGLGNRNSFDYLLFWCVVLYYAVCTKPCIGILKT